jgi:aryl-alcohol dehydrogenase-like predicted oxidoreductase
MAIHAYGVLNQGQFQSVAAFAEREKNNPGRKMKVASAKDKAVSALLEAVGERQGVSVTAVALAYCMAKAPYVFPIIGGRTVEQLKGNIEALRVRLSEEDIREIEKGYDFDPGFPHTFLSGTLWRNETPKGAYEAKDVSLLKYMGNFDWVEGPKAIQPAAEE